MKPLRFAAAALIIGAVILVAVTSLRTPRLDRDWADDVAVIADIDLASDESRFTLRQVRDWRYTGAAPVSRDRFDATYAAADLVGMSFYEQKLDPSGLIAHTFVAFEFAGDYRYPRIGISVETRREKGEQYSLLKGALRGFELMHTWASEADLVERRVKYLGYELTRYRVRRPLAEQRRYLLRFLGDTIALAGEARWYNTITSNCTNVIIGAANDLEPGFIPFDKSWVLTGLATEFLIERGVLDEHDTVVINGENVEPYVANLRAGPPANR